MVLRVVTITLAAAVFVTLAATRVLAQDDGPKIGEMAPDFSLPGASKVGVREKALRLSDFRGQVVVVSFFPKARTKG